MAEDNAFSYHQPHVTKSIDDHTYGVYPILVECIENALELSFSVHLSCADFLRLNSHPSPQNELNQSASGH